jgi:hypothetical protein
METDADRDDRQPIFSLGEEGNEYELRNAPREIRTLVKDWFGSGFKVETTYYVIEQLPKECIGSDQSLYGDNAF